MAPIPRTKSRPTTPMERPVPVILRTRPFASLISAATEFFLIVRARLTIRAGRLAIPPTAGPSRPNDSHTHLPPKPTSIDNLPMIAVDSDKLLLLSRCVSWQSS